MSTSLRAAYLTRERFAGSPLNAGGRVIGPPCTCRYSLFFEHGDHSVDTRRYRSLDHLPKTLEFPISQESADVASQESVAGLPAAW